MGSKISTLELNLHEELLKEGFVVVGQSRDDSLLGFLKNSKSFHEYDPKTEEYVVLPISLISVDDIKESLPGFKSHEECPLKYFVYMRKKT